MKSFLHKCLLNSTPVEIMYISGADKISQRTITIKEIQDTTMRAYCHLRKTTRLFKIENILSVNYKKALNN